MKPVVKYTLIATAVVGGGFLGWHFISQRKKKTKADVSGGKKSALTGTSTAAQSAPVSEVDSIAMKQGQVTSSLIDNSTPALMTGGHNTIQQMQKDDAGLTTAQLRKKYNVNTGFTKFVDNIFGIGKDDTASSADGVEDMD